MFWLGYLCGAVSVIAIVVTILYWINRHASVN